MAHFAQLDANNKVLQVVVVNNNAIKDQNGIEQEDLGVAFCKQLYGADTNWKQTSYNGAFRARFAGVGYYYDAEHDAFIPSLKSHPSWVFDNTLKVWAPPIPMPNDGIYEWDEPTLSWKFIRNIC